MSDLESRVLENLVRLRKQAGLSQKQVEQRLDWRANTLHDIEKGRLRLSFLKAIKLSELYHSDISELLKHQGSIEAETTDGTDDLPSTQLASLGIISGAHHPLVSRITEDPVIVAEIGLGQLGKQPLMELLLANLTETQQRYFVLDLYRYINSLIAADGDIRDSELAIRDVLIRQAQITLDDREKKSIARAFTKPYFGKSLAKSLPRAAYQHFLIWVLHLVSRIDGNAHFKAKEYIRQVAEHIQLPVSAFRYIEEQVNDIYPAEF